MEIRHVVAFVAVADELNFSRAAARIRIGQPAMSRLIQQLERMLGVRLIDRSTHHVSLTPAGQAFLPAARDLLDQVERARRAARGGTDDDRQASRRVPTRPLSPAGCSARPSVNPRRACAR